jgi:hypothetical protein
MDVKEVTQELTSGKTAKMRPLKGKDIRMVQRLMGGDESKFVFAAISQAVTIDGNPITIEELDEMPMGDVMPLMSMVSGFLV